MTAETATDWNPGTYLRFRGFRLRPALDLLAAVPDLPPGDLVDLGCGTGVMGEALKARFPGRRLHGVDASPAMLEKARASGHYATLAQGDIAGWRPETPPALLYSNAALHWLPDHPTLFPGLAGLLPPGGILAVQMPRQFNERSHELLREVSTELFPDRFDRDGSLPPVAPPETYLRLLSPLGDVRVWETIYYQNLAPVAEGHPVRAFTESTAARPILERLSDSEAAEFLSCYDAALASAYPVGPDGHVVFPFRRLFLTLARPD